MCEFRAQITNIDRTLPSQQSILLSQQRRCFSCSAPLGTSRFCKQCGTDCRVVEDARLSENDGTVSQNRVVAAIAVEVEPTKAAVPRLMVMGRDCEDRNNVCKFLGPNRVAGVVNVDIAAGGNCEDILGKLVQNIRTMPSKLSGIVFVTSGCFSLSEIISLQMLMKHESGFEF